MKSSVNEITGNNLVSKCSNQSAYAEGYDRIFRKEEIKKVSKPIVLSNKIQCNRCGDIIESKHVHDYRTCSCGHVSVDGGLDYMRRIGNDFTDLSEVTSKDKEDWFERVRETFTWGSYGRGGKGPKKSILLKDLDTEHIEAILSTQWHIKNTYVEQYMLKELEYRKVSND